MSEETFHHDIHSLFKLSKQFLTEQQEMFGSDLPFLKPTHTVNGVVEKKTKALKEFYDEIKNCQSCKLHSGRKYVVFGDGHPDANLMVIGEGPGADEDESGHPFVGRAGQLLTSILKAINFSRQDVFIANIVKCRPPGNRNPEPDEIGKCLPYLQRQIDIIQPKLILALGKTCASTLLNTTEAIGKLRGQFHDYQGIPIMVTYHPAALLRNPNFKLPTWEDVQKLRKKYDEMELDKNG